MPEQIVTDEDEDTMVVSVGDEAYLVDKASAMAFTIVEDEAEEPAEVGYWNEEQRQIVFDAETTAPPAAAPAAAPATAPATAGEQVVLHEDEDTMEISVGGTAYYLVDKASAMAFTIVEDEAEEPAEVGYWDEEQRQIVFDAETAAPPAAALAQYRAQEHRVQAVQARELRRALADR